jgi:hypothetical protein
MGKKLLFVAGAGVGYVLGTRAGREKYDQMVGKARELMDRPEVKDATRAVQAQADRLYVEGRALVRDKVRGLHDRTDRPLGDAGVGLDATMTRYASGAEPIFTSRNDEPMAS